IPPVGQHQLTVTASNASGSTTSAAVPVIIELFAGVRLNVGLGGAPQPRIDRTIEVNANMWRTSRFWSKIETTAGVYNWNDAAFANIETVLVPQGNAAGVRGETAIAYGNSLYSNPSLDGAAGAQGRTKYGDFGQALAARFGNSLRLFSIWNEYPGGFAVPDQDAPFDGLTWKDATPARYYAIQQAAYAKIKVGNPQAIVTGPVSVTAKTYNTDWITTLRDLPGGGGDQYIDWVNVHTYPASHTADPARRPETGARWMKNELNPIFPTPKPIIVTEYGYSTSFTGNTEAEKAEFVARAYMSARTVPNMRGFVWYELHHSGANSFGLCLGDAALTRLAAFYSYQDIALIFRRALYYGRGAPNTGTEPLWFLKFKDTTGDVYVAWREEDGPTSLSFTFTASAAGNLSVRPVKTTSTPPAATNVAFSSGSNTKSITLTTMPKFIRVPAGVTVTPAASYNFSTNPIP
ncbi:MAG: cellulase family glycosylhydrolase, partial [Opitutaceae bacterium]